MWVSAHEHARARLHWEGATEWLACRPWGAALHCPRRREGACGNRHICIFARARVCVLVRVCLCVCVVCACVVCAHSSCSGACVLSSCQSQNFRSASRMHLPAFLPPPLPSSILCLSPCLPSCLPLTHWVLTKCRQGTPSKASGSQQGIRTKHVWALVPGPIWVTITYEACTCAPTSTHLQCCARSRIVLRGVEPKRMLVLAVTILWFYRAPMGCPSCSCDGVSPKNPLRAQRRWAWARL